MTYRDDQDALLARADALEGDNERLRAENERLRAATPDDAVLQELAGRAEESEEAHSEEATAARRERTNVRTPAARGPDRLAVELSARSSFPPLLLVPAVLGALAVAGATGAMWMLPVGVGGGLIVGLIVVWLVRRSRIAWIRNLPFPLDRDSLADRINDGPEERAIRIRVRFLEPVANARRATIAKAVTGAWGAATGCWEGDDLLVVTTPVTSYRNEVTRRGKHYRIFVPAPFLAACRRVMVDCLGPVHAAAPIAAAAFEA